ncbi:type II toxin-antitoxin system VapC family toxin [Methanoplanus limicola]|uniref:PilT protein domain protein n=1 Tax=Methanoplanus limicola DSM 2279 TaxID=937775 RepID=H1Z1F6_9EURY|nr:type II toxin-antitoxin system VapC family toxin [Methanoplanus limicola]EHQ36303.1 PilT protein domain protein [Methanoplanus limicola DSM 2279]
MFNTSIITNIEFLGWSGHTETGYRKAVEFMSYSRIFSLNKEISEITIDLRRKYKIKLPDAVIAATAINYDLNLITRNEGDFNNIHGLEIYNPFI